LNVARQVLQHCSWRITRQWQLPLVSPLPSSSTPDSPTRPIAADDKG
jgi:hypothetical protein